MSRGAHVPKQLPCRASGIEQRPAGGARQPQRSFGVIQTVRVSTRRRAARTRNQSAVRLVRTPDAFAFVTGDSMVLTTLTIATPPPNVRPPQYQQLKGRIHTELLNRLR